MTIAVWIDKYTLVEILILISGMLVVWFWGYIYGNSHNSKEVKKE